MERAIQRSSRSRCDFTEQGLPTAGLIECVGPAHAVYFASYEAVKHALGGNEGGKDEHHPLAAGV